MSDDKSVIVEECRPLLKQIADNLGANMFLSHGGASWLDFKFFELLDLLHFLSDGVFYQEMPHLWDYYLRMQSLDNISAYMADSSKCMYAPFNGMMAKINNI
jgi:hypothetical protein